MKKFFIGVGKAALYFGTYLGCQFLTSFAICIVIALVLSLQVQSGNMNAVEYMTTYTNLVNQSIYYILILAGILNLLIYWIVTLIRKKKFYQEVSLRKMNPVIAFPIIFGGVAFNFLMSFLMTIIPFPQAWWSSYEAKSSSLMGGGGITLWIATVIAAPVVEEIVFRGFVFSRLKTGMNKWIALIVTSFLFGCVHGTIIWGTYTFIFGAVLILILERCKSLWACILFHMAFNVVGAASSTWPEVFESLNSIAVLAGSLVVAVACTIWFILITKEKKETL